MGLKILNLNRPDLFHQWDFRVCKNTKSHLRKKVAHLELFLM